MGIRFKQLSEQAKKDSDQLRENLTTSLKSFNDLLREKFGQLETKQGELILSTEKKLEEMRATVDEKLQKTLTERIGQSFEMVGKQLENVQKGLGEMQTLAQDVGGLKKVLSNVKMRGGYGEIQLAMLLEQVLAPEQYEANVKTKTGSNDAVEFAIKLPGRDEASSVVYLPIDAKFPKDAYEQLLAAYELGDATGIEISAKAYEDRVKSMAKTIHDKYIDPPNTTDFAIMFLPFESMYAEVIRKPALVEALQRDFKILVVGPMNLAGLLNSLQMGFRTLAIQQRASEVWKVLGAVKTEFDNFGGLLEKAQKNLATASNQIDEVVGRRTRAIKRTLKDVQALPAAESQQLILEVATGEVTDEDEA
ncbi:MAG: DNA recombination protein RmuC [Flavobacteriales bacterium]|nr:DNA recombination protein RmuC [Flavobacteriales bacterium]